MTKDSLSEIKRRAEYGGMDVWPHDGRDVSARADILALVEEVEACWGMLRVARKDLARANERSVVDIPWFRDLARLLELPEDSSPERLMRKAVEQKRKLAACRKSLVELVATCDRPHRDYVRGYRPASHILYNAYITLQDIGNS